MQSDYEIVYWTDQTKSWVKIIIVNIAINALKMMQMFERNILAVFHIKQRAKSTMLFSNVSKRGDETDDEL